MNPFEYRNQAISFAVGQVLLTQKFKDLDREQLRMIIADQYDKMLLEDKTHDILWLPWLIKLKGVWAKSDGTN